MCVTDVESLEYILEQVAYNDDEYLGFIQTYPLDIPLNYPKELYKALAEETFKFLKQDNNFLYKVEAVITDDITTDDSFIHGRFNILTLVAITFLLRTHIKIEKTINNEWFVSKRNTSLDKSHQSEGQFKRLISKLQLAFDT